MSVRVSRFIVLVIVVLIMIFIYQILQNQSEDDFKPVKIHRDEPSMEQINTGNIPQSYFNNQTKPKPLNKTCGIYPDFFSLKIHNDFWQKQQTRNGTFFLLNAYEDSRNNSIKILGTYSLRTNQSFFCLFWYQGKPAVIVESLPVFWIFVENWGADVKHLDHPYLVTCPLDEHPVPQSVSLLEQPCEKATNNLKVLKSETDQKNFVVCVKGLSFPYDDKSSRLVEWIELLNLLGADKIHFYNFNVHANMQKVLDYYTRSGLVEVTPLTLVGDVSNQPFPQSYYLSKKLIERRLQEVLPYSDCLYKHLNQFKYVVLLDTDEVIVPVENTWIELIQTMEKIQPNSSSYMARNVYFFDAYEQDHEWFNDVPKYMHMLQHVLRSSNYTKPKFFVKGFHKTERAVALHNHFPLACVNKCNPVEIDLDVAHLQHYRSDCVRGLQNCDEMKKDAVLDTRVWNFKEELVKRVGRTLWTLGLVELE